MSISRGVNKEDVVHLYKGILLSHQKEFAATWMVIPEIVILSEASHTEKENYCVTSLIGGLYKDIIQMNLQNRDSQT